MSRRTPKNGINKGWFEKGHKFIFGGEKGWFKKGQHPSADTEFKKGSIPWIKGRHPIGKNKGKHWKMREDKRQNMSRGRGENHHSWLGGKSFEPYSVDWTETLKRSIRERDHYICQLCSQYGNSIHHINYNKKNCSPSNLITLCISCNSKVNKNRE